MQIACGGSSVFSWCWEVLHHTAKTVCWVSIEARCRASMAVWLVQKR